MNFSRNAALWIFGVVLLFVLFNIFQGASVPGDPQQLAYSEMMDDVRAGLVKDVTIRGQVITGHFTDSRPFSSYAPEGANYVEIMQEKGVVIDAGPAEDDANTRAALAEVLRSEGHHVTEAADGKQARFLFEQRMPDIACLDVMMPGEGGAETYRELKQDPDLQSIPVILLSAVKKDSFLHYLSLLNTRLPDPIPPPITYLEKPVEPEDLVEAAKAALAI